MNQFETKRNIFIIFICLLTFTNCKKNAETIVNNNLLKKTLYNGILLPDEWPPQYGVPTKAKNMPVPYLSSPPEVISVNIGRQLFVDDFLIEENALKRTFHYPQFEKNNPVLESDKPWEKTVIGAPYASPFSDGIWYDEKDQKFKMWYLAGGGSLFDRAQSFVTCYAESDDGINWQKPIFDIVSGTNVVEKSWRDSNTMWLDKLEKDSKKRYKLFNVEFFEKDRRWRFVIKYSADGINWSKGIAQSGDIWDRSTVFYNPFRKVWVFGTRVYSPSGRARAYLEHTDHEVGVSLVHKIFDNRRDKHNVFWFGAWKNEVRNPDFPDVQPGIYNHDAIAYESLLLGFFNVWQGPENNICDSLGIQKRNELLIGYTRDGFHWDRPDMNRFMGVSGTINGNWNDGNMQSINGVPLIVGDSLYFYSSGRKTNKVMWDSYTSTGLAKLRRDGFASLDATENEASVTTRKITFNGQHLFVNADASKGQLLAELLNENGVIIKGFSKDDCIPITSNGTKIDIHWKKNKQLGDYPNPVKLKFYLTNTSLYSFWVSKYKTGESGGYTAGGGPGLHPSGRDLPVK